MHEADGYFDEPVAATYDESVAEMFDPAALAGVCMVFFAVGLHTVRAPGPLRHVATGARRRPRQSGVGR